MSHDKALEGLQGALLVLAIAIASILSTYYLLARIQLVVGIRLVPRLAILWCLGLPAMVCVKGCDLAFLWAETGSRVP